MRDIRVAAAQFEGRDDEKPYNLGRIDHLTELAAGRGAEVVSFHECCISGYTFVMHLGRDELVRLAEPVPDGPSTCELVKIARQHKVAVLAGLVEIEDDRIYNTYVAVGPEGFIAKHRKLHPFISKFISSGAGYTVFELGGCRVGILICYDNNLPENVRITAMMGAEIIFMPHVTGGLDSPMPGRGRIDPDIWENRHGDPVRCRQEFNGPKGRGWLMRWLPARAYENGVYAIFTNPIGVDHDTIKPGNTMILDPFGEILVESHELGDDVVVGLLTADKLPLASGRRYLRARRPELYQKLVEPKPADEPSVTQPGWMLKGAGGGK